MRVVTNSYAGQASLVYSKGFYLVCDDVVALRGSETVQKTEHESHAIRRINTKYRSKSLSSYEGSIDRSVCTENWVGDQWIS